MKNANQLEFNTVMRYANGLKNLIKYHIGLSKDKSGKDKLTNQIDQFASEKERLAEKYKGQNLDVTQLENFAKTAVYLDRQVEKLRKGTN